jgi:hypothetical protein
VSVAKEKGPSVRTLRNIMKEEGKLFFPVVFDAEGNVHDWWDAYSSDEAEYKAKMMRARCEERTKGRCWPVVFRLSEVTT